MVSFTNATTDTAVDDNAMSTVNIYFDVSKEKFSEIDNVFLDKACNSASDISDNSLRQMSTDYLNGSNESCIIWIGLDTTTNVLNQDLFTDNALLFYVRIDITGWTAGYGESISFTETAVLLNYDMEAGFEIKDTLLEEIEVMKFNKKESFKVEAWMCTMNSNNVSCSASKLRLNSEFGLCIFSFLDTIKGQTKVLPTIKAYFKKISFTQTLW